LYHSGVQGMNNKTWPGNAHIHTASNNAAKVKKDVHAEAMEHSCTSSAIQ